MPHAATPLRREVAFLSDGVTCRAWLYEPATGVPRPAPCIVMAHGLGGTRDASLSPYAERFAAAGFYVLLFDYRHLGDSDGEPRQLISMERQLADWGAAINFARTAPGVDAERIGLWGCSLAGGHVLVAAARDKRIAAVRPSARCSTAPRARALRSGKPGSRCQCAWPARRCSMSSRVHGKGALLRATCRSARRARRNGNRGCLCGVHGHRAPGWRNEVAARLFFTLPLYTVRRVSPATSLAPRCLSPARTTPSRRPARWCRRAPAWAVRAQVILLPIGHFDIYLGKWFERSSSEQLAFFRTPLLLPARSLRPNKQRCL
jgi:predicted acyl esterase